jgi:hypothetical protein
MCIPTCYTRLIIKCNKNALQCPQPTLLATECIYASDRQNTMKDLPLATDEFGLTITLLDSLKIATRCCRTRMFDS